LVEATWHPLVPNFPASVHRQSMLELSLQICISRQHLEDPLQLWASVV